MKGDVKVIEQLNAMLSDELTAINQYIVHSEMCADWGYGKLHEHVEARAITEMKHAEMLIGRILFLEGMPIVSNLQKIQIGGEVKLQLENDLMAEIGASKGYNEAIRVAVAANDNVSRELFEKILHDEEDHIDWIEAQLDQIEQMGVQLYLVEQVD